MPRNLNETGSRVELARRVDALREDTAPSWGRMSSGRMLAHLIESLRMATGDLAVPPAGPWLLRIFPFKQAGLYGPWPKGASTAPALLARAPGAFEADRAEFKRWLDRHAEALGKGRVWPHHFAFGPLSERQWGHLLYKHFDHHFRQFGV
jgi:hypothetical protein